ncbi:SMI1/KNR4 family protein [Kineosporia sp. NBRC 101677]|uniref:SMI1/KNR4 family protein n=1 Tax=Kineosporia sp. NBRC 101677 TaxID=3032197 RepID=UPI0025557B2C|nr:SMI1/KNR4 family protein [Kineosporia sp. NBRC 101677]
MRLSSTAQWHEFLRGFCSRTRYAPSQANGDSAPLPLGQGPAWHGRRPATPAEVQAAEQRLGRPLPPSLRSFLTCSNGWSNADSLQGLLSTTQLRWARSPEHDLVDAWSSFEEIIEVIADCLVVLDDSRGQYGLIDAARISPDGEWTAYAWAAGSDDRPRPFPSFSALVTSLAGTKDRATA